jgi:pimeloyl-ACP methyl ester carboxylesterase
VRYFSRDGLTFDLDDLGPQDGDVVVLLHGWPQDRTSWHSVAPRLADAGLRVLAPDLRGYSPASAPPMSTRISSQPACPACSWSSKTARLSETEQLRSCTCRSKSARAAQIASS